METTPAEKPSRVSELLADMETCAMAGDLGGLGGTITRAMAPPSVIREIAASDSFWRNAEALLNGVAKDNDHAVTLALAQIGRLRSSLKPPPERLRHIAASILAGSAPRHFCHGDAELTTFAAKAWACSARPVDLEVAVRTVVTAEAPKPLVPWLELAFSAGDLEAVLGSITACLREVASYDVKQPRRRASRLQRVLRAVRVAAYTNRVAQGSGIAGAVADLVANAYRGVRPLPPYPAAAKAVDELMDLAVHLIHVDLRLLTVPAIYNSVAKAATWLPEGGWRRFRRSAASVVKLRKLLLDGLIILLKQHNPSEALLECHRALSPDGQAALAEQKAAAEADREIPAKERRWLASGGTVPVDSAFEEENQLTETDDTVVGMALLAAEALAACELFASGDTADGPVRELVERSREVRQRVLSVARRRKLDTFGKPRERVRFSSNAHRLVGRHSVAEDVEIIEPGVESQGTFGARVVVPALVKEP